MSSPQDSRGDRVLVGRQLGREPREPWRVASRCSWGYPNVIVSPSLLADRTPFPTWAWLTCPYLAEKASAAESAGEVARWARRAASDLQTSRSLLAADATLRAARAAESHGADSCEGVGVAGQRDVLGVKCLHAWVALSLMGIDNHIGEEVLSEAGSACDDRRCAALTGEGPVRDA